MTSSKRLVILPLSIIMLTSCQTFTSLLISSSTSNLTTSTASTTSTVVTSTMPSSLSMYRDITEMLDILYAAGYEDIEDLNNEGIWDYREQTYLGENEIVVDVLGFYQGYIPVYTRWMMMEEFGTEAQAGAVVAALLADTNFSNNLHREGNIVLQTGSVETWLLFQ